MSRILRRPMFRGGPVDSRGTGITANLGYNNGGRVGYNKGNLVAPLYSAAPNYKSGAEIKRDAPGIFGLKFDSPFLSMKTPENRFGGSLNFGQSPRELSEALSEGSSYTNYLKNLNQPEEFETETLDTGEVKFKLDKDGKKIPIETEELSLKEQIEKDRVQKITDSDTQGSLEELGITVKDDGTTEFTGDPRYSDQKIKKTDTSGIKLPPPPTEKEESVEYTVEDYVKMLGGDKARRRDLSDMLASASASFLGTGGVKEGFAEFMSREAAKGPGRLEKIEQAAATLDIKDKIDSKRSKEKIELMKENTLFELRAKSDALKAAGDISKMNAGDALTYISKEIYRGQKDRSSSRVLKTFLDIKLNTDSNVKNVGDLTSFLNDAEEVSSLPEGITIVTSDQGKRVYLKRGDKVELVDINKL